MGELWCGGGGHAYEVAAEPILDVARDRHALGRLGEEPPRQRPPLREAPLGQDPGDLVGIPVLDVIDSVVDASLPAEAPFDGRVLDQVGHLDGQHRVAESGLPVEIVDDATPQLPLALLVTPAQVSAERFAYELVEGQAVAQGLGEGHGAQALIGEVRVTVGQHCPQQFERGHAGDGGDAECRQANALELRLGQPPDQRAHHLRPLRPFGRTPVAIGGGGVGGQREGQR